MRLIGYIGLLGLSCVLFGPSLKLAFKLTDLAVYYVPGITFAASALLMSVLVARGLAQRIQGGLLPLLLFAASGFSYLVGGAGETALLQTIFINCLFAALVAMFPWDRNYFDTFTLFLVLGGLVLSVYAIDVYRTTGDFSGLDERVRIGYLSTSFALGIAAICALYHLVRSFNPLTLGAFAVCWLGLALGQGRGAVVFCSLVTFVYVIAVLYTRLPGFGRGKKTVLIGTIALMVPVALTVLLSVERNASRFTRLFSGEELLGSGTGRYDIWSDTLERINEAPLFGHGLGSYYVDEVTPHNVFLQYGEDSGLVGILIICVFLLLVVRLLFRAKSIASPASVNAVYCTAALFTYMLLNFQKSYDAYIAREIYVLSALPIGLFAYLLVTRGRISTRRRTSVDKLLTH